MKKHFAMFTRDIYVLENGKLVNKKAAPELVRIMAIAEGHAMVRFPCCIPFIVRQKDLQDLPN